MPTLTPPARLVFVDWLRIAAFALLVPYHVGMYYVSWPWHVKSPHASAALEPWMLLTGPWRMSLLFLVSGIATSLMLARRGADGAWLKQRAKRLGLPLLAGVALVVPVQSYFEVVQQHGYAGGYLDFLRLYFTAYGGFCGASGACLILPTWNHLWFLPYVLVYTALMWMVLRHRPAALDRLAAALPRLLAGAGLLGLPIVWLFTTRVALRDAFPPTHALVDDAFLHSQYLPMFVLGAALARAPALWWRFEQARWIALVLALAGWALLVVGSTGALRALAASTEQWAAIVSAAGFAHRHLHADGPWRRTLTEAVFPLYVLHQSATIVLAMAIAPLALAPWTEGPLLVIGTFALCALGFVTARRVAWLAPWLGIAAPRGMPAGAVRGAPAAGVDNRGTAC
jgi:surface polysaccharide O-acyltransferase-like enzyme